MRKSSTNFQWSSSPGASGPYVFMGYPNTQGRGRKRWEKYGEEGGGRERVAEGRGKECEAGSEGREGEAGKGWSGED